MQIEEMRIWLELNLNFCDFIAKHWASDRKIPRRLRKDQQLQLQKDSVKSFASPRLDSPLLLDSPALHESPKRLYAQNFCLLFLMVGNNR